MSFSGLNEAAVERLQKIRCFLLDMDGTFYLGDQIIEGSMDFIRHLKKTGRQFIFLTNNSSKSGKAYLNKLAGMGLHISAKQLVTSGQATIDYLNKHMPNKTVYLLGNLLLADEFEKGGIRLEKRNPDAVITAYDNTLDYHKLCTVCDLVRSGLPYIATHPDVNCPTAGGFLPDIGAIHAFIHASTGRLPDRIIGKPYREIIDYALEQADCKAQECAMVGDRLYTDIATIQHLPGLTGVLVLSGETKAEDLVDSKIQPHVTFQQLKDMIPFLNESHRTGL